MGLASSFYATVWIFALKYHKIFNSSSSMLTSTPWLGEIAALLAAFLWASASLVYTRLGQSLSPILLNILKGGVAIAFLLLTLALTRVPLGFLTPSMLGFLVISGILGIGLGDTAYLSALRYLGARLTLLLETLAPVITAILARVFLGETLDLWAWGGIFLTLVGVGWVVTERTTGVVLEEGNFRLGILWGVLAALAQAVGAVLSRSVLMTGDISPLWTALIRLLAGTAIALGLWPFLGRSRTPAGFSWSPRLLGIIILTAFASTYLGIWLQQISLKYAAAGIAQTLTSTSPLFVLPLASLMGEKISLRAITGVIISLVGVSFLFFFSG
jgi:drug/metabolite transporter (DMT)-like permease